MLQFTQVLNIFQCYIDMLFFAFMAFKFYVWLFLLQLKDKFCVDCLQYLD